MARLHEYQGKDLLAAAKISIPKGRLAHSPEEARDIAAEIGGPVVLKAQAWITGRAAVGAIRFVKQAAEVVDIAREMMSMTINGVPVDILLVEQMLEIEREFYAGVIIDDQEQAPLVIFSSRGGSGIEEIAEQHPEAVSRLVVDVQRGLLDYQARDLVRRAGLSGQLLLQMGTFIQRLYGVARQYDARAAEINPVALTSSGALVAADCRITLDDYAVFRHPELGIEIAREFDRPPTDLERIAWEVEKNDYRGTFYFIQLEHGFKTGDGVLGFHGAGGGGSMMSMDALQRYGYRPANFVDTSGNPPASKVYRAARIILHQAGLDGYFASGSGVASQEQFHSARGLAKAFLETPLTIPAVLRLGGNAEEKAIDILQRASVFLPAPIACFGKDDSPEYCASHMDTLIRSFTPATTVQPPLPAWELPQDPYSFETVTGGRITFDHAKCRACESKACIQACVPQILRLEDGVPLLAISPEAAKEGRCIECLACEVDCFLEGNRGARIDLPIPGLDDEKHAPHAIECSPKRGM